MAPQYINVPLEYRWLTIHLRKKESTIHFDISDFVLTNSCGQYLQKGIHEQILYIGNHTHMTSMKFVQIFNFHSSIFKLPTPPPTSSLPLKMMKLKPHYLLYRGFTFLCVQLSKNITKCFLKKSFFVLILQSTCLFCITWKRKQTMEHQPHRACEWMKSNQN